MKKSQTLQKNEGKKPSMIFKKRNSVASTATTKSQSTNKSQNKLIASYQSADFLKISELIDKHNNNQEECKFIETIESDSPIKGIDKSRNAMTFIKTSQSQQSLTQNFSLSYRKNPPQAEAWNNQLNSKGKNKELFKGDQSEAHNISTHQNATYESSNLSIANEMEEVPNIKVSFHVKEKEESRNFPTKTTQEYFSQVKRPFAYQTQQKQDLSDKKNARMLQKQDGSPKSARISMKQTQSMKELCANDEIMRKINQIMGSNCDGIKVLKKLRNSQQFEVDRSNIILQEHQEYIAKVELQNAQCQKEIKLGLDKQQSLQKQISEVHTLVDQVRNQQDQEHHAYLKDLKLLQNTIDELCLQHQRQNKQLLDERQERKVKTQQMASQEDKLKNIVSDKEIKRQEYERKMQDKAVVEDKRKGVVKDKNRQLKVTLSSTVAFREV